MLKVALRNLRLALQQTFAVRRLWSIDLQKMPGTILYISDVRRLCPHVFGYRTDAGAEHGVSCGIERRQWPTGRLCRNAWHCSRPPSRCAPLWAILRRASSQGIYKTRRFTPARLTSVGANRLEASVQDPWTS